MTGTKQFDTLKWKECSRCGYPNEADDTYCKECCEELNNTPNEIVRDYEVSNSPPRLHS